MTIPNFGNASEFNTALYDSLIESIRRRILNKTEQQREANQGGEPAQQRDARPLNFPIVPSATSYGSMAEQDRQNLIAPSADRLQATPASPNPNFRQLVRTSPLRYAQSISDVSAGSGDLPSSSASVSGAPSQLARPVPTLAGPGMLGRTAPLLPGPTTVTSVPMLPVPETWKFAWKLLQILPEVARDAATGNKFGADQEHEHGENGSTTVSREKQERDVQSPGNATSPENSGRHPQGNDRGPPAGLLGLLLRLQQYERQQRSSSGDDDDEDDRFEKSYQKIQKAKEERLKKGKYSTGDGGGDGNGDDAGDVGGGGGRGRRKKYDICEERREAELLRCQPYWADRVHSDYYHGCTERAWNRSNLCYSNKGKPRFDEPQEWRPGSDKNPGDEETGRNYGR